MGEKASKGTNHTTSIALLNDRHHPAHNSSIINAHASPPRPPTHLREALYLPLGPLQLRLQRLVLRHALLLRHGDPKRVVNTKASQPTSFKKKKCMSQKKERGNWIEQSANQFEKKSHSFVCHKERKKETTTGLSELSLPVPACLLLQLRRLLLQRRRGRLLLELVEGGAHQKLGVGALLLGVLVVNVVVGWGLR